MSHKSLIGKTGKAVSSAARSVTHGLKAAGEAVVEAITPNAIRTGDRMIIPSVDPSMTPVVVPVKKRTRRSDATKKSRATRTSTSKPGRSAARKSKAAGRRTATRKTARRTAAKRTRSAGSASRR